MKGHPIKQNVSANQKQIVKEKKDEMVSLEEVNKVISGFNLEHELNKVKILVPLTELIKNKAYREVAFKTFKNAVKTIPSDEINLQDEKPTIIVGFVNPKIPHIALNGLHHPRTPSHNTHFTP